MQSPQLEKGSEDQFEIPPIGDLDTFFPDPNCSFNFGAEKVTTNIGANNSESAYNPNHHLEQISKQGFESDILGDDTSHKLESATIAAPPSSRSNPETPKEQFDFSLGDLAPTMTRYLSEQSGLASLTPGHSNHPDSVQRDNIRQSMAKVQHHDHPLAWTSMRRSSSRGWSSQVGAIASSADGSHSMPAMSCNPHQEGLDLGAQHGFGARHSYLRTPVRPSSLRNIVSANSISPQPADIYSSVTQVVGPNQHFVQPIPDTSIAQENLNTLRNRRHTDTAMFSRNSLINPYPMVDQGPVYGGIIGGPTNYADSNQQYSPFNIPRSVPHNYGMHGHLIHPSADSHQHINRIFQQQRMDSSVYNLQPQESAFEHRMHTTMKREDPSSNSGPQRVSYQTMEETEASKIVQTKNLDDTSSAPTTAEERELYINKILSAMYDTSRAQDNAGMISAWKTQMNDKEAVEGIARDLLEVCIRREALGRPFRKGLKPSHRFRTFDDHFDALMEALTTQKTMCKHLLRQPYIEEIVDDPLGSIARITNNRKVNKGKKLAIEKGREALGQEGKSRRSVKVLSHVDTDDEQDAENESFDEEQYETLLKRSSATLHQSRSPGDSHDPSYREGSAPKRVKRASRSKYQLNEKNEMIDTSESPVTYPTYRNQNVTRGTSRRPSDEQGHQQQSDYVMSHLRRQSYESTIPSDFSPHSISDPHFSQPENDDNQHAEYQPLSASRPRRTARR